MARKFHKCIVCGKDLKGRYGKGKEVKLPNGSIHLCNDRGCLDTLNHKANDGAVPVVWFSLDDFIERELADEKIVEALNGDSHVATQLAREVGDFLWSGEFLGNMWGESLEEAVASLEEFYILQVKDSDLPLVKIKSLKSEKAKTLLEKRLKGE